MTTCRSTIFGLVTAVLSSIALMAQIESPELRNPDPLPRQLTPAQPRVFQVYGCITTLYRDTITIVDQNGDSVRVDTVRRRAQTVSWAPTTDSSGDTLYMYSTVGLTAIDRLTKPDEDWPVFSGRDSAGVFQNLHRRLGFWLDIQVVNTVPDPDNPVVAGPSVQAWPNPFRDDVFLRIARGMFEDVETYAYTIDGRLLAQLPLESSDDDGFVFKWDGRDPDGNPVASGTYIVRLLARIAGSAQRVGYSAKIVRAR